VTGRDVRVVFTKYDGGLHWHQTMRHLGQDEHGVWLGAPAGLLARRGDEPPIVIEQPQLMLFPVDAWWTAVFTAAPAPTEIYCDICTPPRWPQPGEVTMIDLDLDVIRRRADQRVVLLDEDEFAEHQRRYRYPAHVIARAQESAAWLQETIAAGAEPFGGDYLTWLDRIQ
jgi:protein associated with RNAse G/E